MNKILNADAAGPAMQRVYENSHIALAALPLAAPFLKEGSAPYQGLDLALGVAIPVHSHIAINSVVSDYVPKGFKGTTRWVMLGTTGIALAGLLKLNIQGPGIIATVKQLWKKEQPKVIA
ncbi:hypothetical protein WJX74_009450 [Apatococcus lobatus]|uniref:Succinate dehydrogenase [ubiquinone] cytochrome b small subunit n=1 Tax=Apatococcus lobatus TaxID=904363 RepID=A0AAW1RI70_9CHLO